MTVSRATFLKAIDPNDWATTVLRIRIQSDITFDDFVNTMLRDDVIELSKALMERLEVSLRSRPRTLANLRRLAS